MSNKPNLYKEVTASLVKERVDFFDGSNVPSFAYLVNKCVEHAKTETVILMSDKMRPCDADIQKTVNLLTEGYAFVGLYRFGFFGFKKELFRKIGPLDERYQGGGYEDDDYYIRLKEADLAMYLSHEVNYIKGNSSWASDACRQHFLNKWGDVKNTGKALRKIQEPVLDYNYGNSVSTKFLSWDHTQIFAKKVKRYKDIEVIYE
jgi:GT2 family glycosyltransferase